MARLSGAEALAGALARAAADLVFSGPSVRATALHDALAAHGQMRVVTARHGAR